VALLPPDCKFVMMGRNIGLSTVTLPQDEACPLADLFFLATVISEPAPFRMMGRSSPAGWFSIIHP